MLQGEITKGGISRGEMVGGTSPGGGGRELLDPYNSIDKEVKAKALRKWNNINNSKVRHIKSRITSWSTSLHRNRCWKVIIAQLPLGHTRLTHGYPMENGRSPTCSACNTTIAVKHILISCVQYKTKREVVFKDHYINGSEPTMKNILQESNIFSIMH